ncbi:hypothetical protein DPMN_144582 [Dreissena polymorpha]|uniref:Uncharacterized protein n=1 Tax=Dreissena polymorpha TaxID=45954 RepID=A0A9D4GF95_DREPO|nr:hypothetical protein DPMN_144582 [Dreissena polymorpha]
MAVAHTPSDLPPCLDNWTSCEDTPSERLARCLGVDIEDLVPIEAPLTSNAQSSTPCPISPLPESPKISLHSPQKSPPRKVQKRDPDISLSAVAAPTHSRKLTFEQLFNDLESPTKSPNTSSPTCQPKSPVEIISSADGHHTPLKSLPRPLQAPLSKQPLPKSLPRQLQAASTQPLPKSLPRQLQAPPSTKPLPKSLPRQLKAPPSTQPLPTSRTPVSPAQNTPVLKVWPNSSPVAPRQLLIPPSPGSVSSRLSSDVNSAIKDSAMALLCSGGMPLFPPGRHDWTLATPVALPVTGPLSTWPPADWQQMSPEDKLMAWEATAYTLGVSFNFPVSRNYLLDAFQCLALPGSRNLSINSHEAQMRHFNYMALRNIAVEKTPNGPCDSNIVASLQAASSLSMSQVEGPYKTFISSLEGIPLRLHSSESRSGSRSSSLRKK